MQILDDPASLLPLLTPIVALLVNRYGKRILARCERIFRRKPLNRAERRRRERNRRKRP